MRRFAEVWSEPEFVQPLSAQIGWSHHQALLDAFAAEPELYRWYAVRAAGGRWSVRHLRAQIHLRVHERGGAAVTNFGAVLPAPDAEQALQATKDPYVFDFLQLEDDARERELEQALIDDIQEFLLELGSGFAFYGRQLPLLVGDQEFFVDLLFYHHTLRRFVVIELKMGGFEPEHVSKVNFYLNAIDRQLRVGDDRESGWIILCAGRDDAVAELALHHVFSPIAVSTWQQSTEQRSLPPGSNSPDESELAELDGVRERLVERVTRRTAEIIRHQH
jgi:predicted nuclease of restriction endonuclease-like (RecB) superfamily